MTEQYFVALATELFDFRPEANWDANKLIQWNQDCRAIIRVCMILSRNFDKARFIAAITRGYSKPEDFTWE